jgi:predicted nucleic acid-binding protein
LRIVIDASVAIKWVIRDALLEPDADKALAILREIRAHTIEVFEPPHWVAEILAVIARARPQRVALTFGILSTLAFKETVRQSCYRRAADIAIQYNHHLFDTLYHAVALEEGATLVTADEAYFAKTAALGNIQRLADFTAP